MLQKIVQLRNRKKRGFTLIELIVTIAILAVLAALALPSFSGLIEESKQEVAMANARTVYSAAKASYAISSSFDDVDDYLGEAFHSGDYTVDLDDDHIVTTWTGNGYTATCDDGDVSID